MSSRPDFSDIEANTKDSTDESRTEDLQKSTGIAKGMNALAQPFQVTAYPHCKNLAKLAPPPTNARTQKQRNAGGNPSSFDSHSDCDSAAPITSKKKTPPSVSSRASTAKKQTRRAVAGGEGRALPNKYNLGNLKPLFNGKCSHLSWLSEHSVKLSTNLQKVGEEVYAAWWDGSTNALRDGTYAS
jgi:hypothetical protein